MENKLLKKLQLKPGKRLALINAPETAAASLGEVPAEVSLSTSNGPADVFLLFTRNSAELSLHFMNVLPFLQAGNVVWIIYPKKNSGIPTDLEMMSHWESLSAHGYRPVASAAFDEQWTAIRMKPSEQVKTTGISNREISANTYSEFIDVASKTVRLPSDLKSAMEKQAASLYFFDSLSYTNRKEYVLWVLSAKQEKTRTERIGKTVEKLLAGKKNPAEK